MKRIMFAAIMAFGVVAQSPMVSVDQGFPVDETMVTSTSAAGNQGDARRLNTAEAGNIIGGDVSGCWTYIDEAGDTHGVCCVDLWIITICVGVNVSAIERVLPF